MDAIAIDLEHRQGYSVTVFIPYLFDSKNQLSYLESRASARKGVIFKPKVY